MSRDVIARFAASDAVFPLDSASNGEAFGDPAQASRSTSSGCRQEILERRQFERDDGRRERGPAEVPGQQRDHANLDDESADPTTLNTPHRRRLIRALTYANCAGKRGHRCELGRTAPCRTAPMTGTSWQLCDAAAARSSTPHGSCRRADERWGKYEARAENRAEHLDVFLRRDAASSTNCASPPVSVVERPRGLLEQHRAPDLRDRCPRLRTRTRTCDVIVVSAGMSP